MANYYFISAQTGKPEKLNKVDDELCEFLGVPSDPKKFHPIFDNMVSFCFHVAMARNSWDMTEAVIDEAKKMHEEKYGESMFFGKDPELIERAFREFLCGKRYQFWMGHGKIKE